MKTKMPRKTKKTTKKVAKKVVKPVAHRTKQDLILAGSSELLPKSTIPLIVDTNKLTIDCARVLGISTLGVTIMDDGNPYINKLGRKEKLEQYLALDKHNWRISYDWIQISKNDMDKAVCQAFFIDNATGEPVSSRVIGECSPATVKEYAGYQNHQAQTRAHNRLIEEVFGVRIHEEMVSRIAELKQQGKIKDIPTINTTVSAEEVEITKPTKETSKGGAVCENCGKSITAAEATFSKKIFHKQLCRNCQPKNLPKVTTKKPTK